MALILVLPFLTACADTMLDGEYDTVVAGEASDAGMYADAGFDDAPGAGEVPGPHGMAEAPQMDEVPDPPIDEPAPDTEPAPDMDPAPSGPPRGLVPFNGFRLPFRCGKTVRVSQGNNTSFSHSGRSRYAYDFSVPRGTVLRAMAPGRVVNAVSRTRPGDACFNGGGPECRNAANYVRIKHSDGSITAYWHLNKALVSRGDRVARGDRIGRSGSTGYSTGPHTHIVREQNCSSIACQSIRLRFRDVGGDGRPNTGQTVTSGNCPNR